MTTDRSLATLLRALQSASSDQDSSRSSIHSNTTAIPLLILHRLLGSAATLLTLLTNPLNVTVLTSHILCAPAIWQNPDGLRTSIRILSVFHSASRHVLHNDDLENVAGQVVRSALITRENWVVAVVKGVDDRSPRWRHLLALGGLFLGSHPQYEADAPKQIQRKLENAMVKATNLAIEELGTGNELADGSVVIALSHCFDILSPSARYQFNYDRLLPILWWAQYFSHEGLSYGYFLSTLDADVVEGRDKMFNWSLKSSSYHQLQRKASSPLLASLGTLARLTAFAIENVQDVGLVRTMVSEISSFSRTLCVQWRQNKLSEIDPSEDASFLDDETLQSTLPLLWRLLKSSMFAIVIVMRSVLGRVIGDSRMPVAQGICLQFCKKEI